LLKIEAEQMAHLRILFADDQIPNDNIHDEDIEKTLKQEHPQWSEGFLNAFVAMRQSVRTLRNAGYDVTLARTVKDALDFAKSTHFDIAIVDLGWFADESLSRVEQEYKGWEICAAIDEADKLSQSQPTPQIIYSNRFVEDAAISMQAADRGKLPVYKNYKAATHESLRASVKFIEALLRKSLEESAVTALPIFNTPSAPLNGWPDVFVMMPFAAELTPVYQDHILPTILKTNRTCKRGDDFFSTQSIMDEVWGAIYHSKICIADCTGRNPNVFYELGIAHTLGRPTILMAQSIDDIPFDIRHRRIIVYQNTPRGIKQLEDMLYQTVTNELANLKL
jgi:hypothetical protein